ncbi:CPBP family intramembrane glutamic endopeptidase [Zongyangia hominis]|uniref:CPBP family intramembrane metalloprotease n=1 Tax=Zongyangia hominis TaxID=2763677 RepID=A0A926EBA0_9FIRM|nr:type II CAAX endopeptidase family protein [Zongyangia hominis]MBC8570628.1 CPBP family intramembrane metalloprotease [Zongyangia hominis]
MDNPYNQPGSGPNGHPMPTYGPQDDEYTYVSGFGFVPTPPDVAEKQSLRSHGSALGITFVIYLLFLSFAPRIITLFFAALLKNAMITSDGLLVAHPAVYQIINIVISVVVYLVPFLFIYRLSVKEKRHNVYPMRVTSRGIMILSIPVSLAIAMVSMVGTNVLIELSSLLGVNASSELAVVPPAEPVALTLFIINMTVVPAVMEELVFRGVIMQSLRKFSDPMALFVSASLFSLAHMSFVKIPYTFLLGLCLGYFVMRTGSLLTGMLIHFANNAYVLAVKLVGSNMPSAVVPIFENIMSIVLIIVGFVALLLLINRYDNMFTLRPNHGYLRVYEQLRSFAAAPAMAIAVIMLVMLISYPYFVAIG